MVLDGQFLERPALVACGELTLEGLYHRGRRGPALLVCPPLEGGGMDAAGGGRAGLGQRPGRPPVAPLPAPRDRRVAGGARPGARRWRTPRRRWRHLAEGGPGLVAAGRRRLGLRHRPRPRRPGAARPLRPRAGRRRLPAALAGRGRLEGRASGPLLLVLPEGGAGAAARARCRQERGSSGCPGPDAAFRSGLPGMGRAVAGWLAELGSRPRRLTGRGQARPAAEPNAWRQARLSGLLSPGVRPIPPPGRPRRPA